MEAKTEKKVLRFCAWEDHVKVFEALSHPMRIKIIGILAVERQYVSELARMVNMSRPLLYMHLKKLETAGLIAGYHEISESGKAAKYYEAVDFDMGLNLHLLADLSQHIVITDRNN